MNFLIEDLTREVKAIEAKISENESLSNDDLKTLLLNILQTEDANEN